MRVPHTERRIERALQLFKEPMGLSYLSGVGLGCRPGRRRRPAGGLPRP